jgi:patatin-related protein
MSDSAAGVDDPKHRPAATEVRVALVMTGGVSLAVWIGGVAAELYRAYHKDGLYELLLDELRSDITIDVISGASAGGLNGVFLGAALSRNLTVDEFSQLREVWLSTGSIKALLRSPRENNPPSLMKGDDYFQVQIENVLRGWLRSRKSALSDLKNGLDVIMTATAISPQIVQRADDLGNVISEPVHRARFHFTADDLAEDPDVLARQMALAARTSASFPGAFEAAFISIGDDPDEIDMTGLASFDRSTWAMDGGVLANKPVSPALDVLRRRTSPRHGRRLLLYVNPDPGQGAVAVDAKRSSPPTMLSVISNALLTLPSVESIAADITEIKEQNARLAVQRDSRYEIVGELTDQKLVELATMMYPLWLRKRTYDAIDQRLQNHFNEAGGDLSTPVDDDSSYLWQTLADRLRQVRVEMQWLGATFPELPELAGGEKWRFAYQPLEYIASIALDLFRRAIDLLPAASYDHSPRGDDGTTETEATRASLEGLRRTVQAVREALVLLRAVDTDYWSANLKAGPRPPASPTIAEEGQPPAVPSDEQRNASDFATRLYQRWPAAPDGFAGPEPDNPYRKREFRRRRTMWARFFLSIEIGFDETRKKDPDIDHPTTDAERTAFDWVKRPETHEMDDVRKLRDRLRVRELELARRLTQALIDCGSAVSTAVRIAEANESPSRPVTVTDSAASASAASERTHVEELGRRLTSGQSSGVAKASAGATGVDLVAALLRKLFALYIVHSMSEPIDETEVRLDFVQVSANADCPLDASRVAPSDKVAGLQLSHFASFYKESWRANDWMWGRLDGAASLVAALVEPSRVRQLFVDRDNAFGAFQRVATGEGVQPPLSVADTTELATRWTRATPLVNDELAALFGPNPVFRADGLKETHRALVAAFQLLIARDELIVVADSVKNSAHAGANFSPAAQVFTSSVRSARETESPTVESASTLPLKATRQLLSQCHVGRETLREEVGSDALTDTATTAAAVVAAAASGDRGGIKAFRHLFATARNVLLIVYMLAQNAIKRSKTAFALTQLLLVFGAGAIAIKISGGAVPTAVALLAVIVLIVWAVITAFTIGTGWALPPLLIMIVVIGWSSLDADDSRNAFGRLASDPLETGTFIADPSSADWRRSLPTVALCIVAAAALGSTILFILTRHKRAQTMRSAATLTPLTALFDRMTAALKRSDENPKDDDLQLEAASMFSVFVDRVRAVRRPTRKASNGIAWSLVAGLIGAPAIYFATKALLATSGHEWLVNWSTWLNEHQPWVVLFGLPLVFVLLSLASSGKRDVRDLFDDGKPKKAPPPGGVRRSFTDGSATRSVAWYRRVVPKSNVDAVQRSSLKTLARKYR